MEGTEDVFNYYLPGCLTRFPRTKNKITNNVRCSALCCKSHPRAPRPGETGVDAGGVFGLGLHFPRISCISRVSHGINGMFSFVPMLIAS